ncbi:MAG: hypothetical protein ACFFBD_09915, partial [Candidatus Hodarchaeota archaeon]
MPYLHEKPWKRPQTADPSRITTELYFVSYIGQLTAEKDQREMYLTRFAKIAVNYVIDWVSSLALVPFYKPYLAYEPNAFGNIPIIPQGPYRYPNYLFSDKIEKMARNAQLWYIKKENDYKKVIFLHEDSDTLEDQLLKLRSKSSSNIDKIQLWHAKTLTEIYSTLNTEDLNILASHRTEEDSEACLRFAFETWERFYRKIKSTISDPEITDVLNLRANILKMVRSCEQIETKVKYIYEGFPRVLRDLENLSSTLEDYYRVISEQIIDAIKDQSSLSRDKKNDFDRMYVF